ncbi:MAG TPA: hypothetical protein VE641_00120 [Chthoniobacterales bacterium]|nr:hypothetical protein [Chthoniobacterales bacterium]
MQTLTFLWFELKAAKRHVKEAVAECQEVGKVDFSLLTRPADSDAIDERPKRQRHLSLPGIAKKEAAGECGPCLQGH